MEPNSADSFYTELGKKMKTARKLAGLTQAQVAEVLNMCHTQINKYEKGTNRIPVDNLIKLSILCNQPFDWFIGFYTGEQQ